MATFRRIGVLTSGGDAPGMNAAVRAVTRAANARGVEVMAIYEGYKGLITDNVEQFYDRNVSNIINRGGTLLYSDRCLEFKTEEGMQKAVETCKRLQIDGIVAIGGDGTFRGALDMTAHGIPCIGIPGTIDNDITSTDYSIGFDTAMNTIVEMIDKLRDTCESHARCNVVEVMGRNAGDIALFTGIATGASAIVLRECEFDEEAAIQRMIEAKKTGKRSFVVVVAEGVDGFAEPFRARIQERTGIETKFVRPAHIVRGGAPTLRDRVLATQMGEKAVELLLEGKSNLVVCMNDDAIVSTDINYALTLDAMYKNKLKPGALDKYSEEQIAAMHAFCDKKYAKFSKLYNMANSLAR